MRVKLRIGDQAAIGLISSPISQEAVNDVAMHWPEGVVKQEDENWEWAKLVQQHPDGCDWRQFLLTAAEHVQGLLIVRTSWPTRSPDNTGTLGAYMEYVATAPWNRQDEEGRRIDLRFQRVAPVGRLLVGVALHLSRKLGYDGRLGWHSKAGAEMWYQSAFPGLWSGGADLEEGDLEYFETSTGNATAYLNRISDSFCEDEIP